MSRKKSWAYVAMSADIIHQGHINIIKIAGSYGNVLIGLLTDRAIASFKRLPIVKYAARKVIVENIKGVDKVVPQTTHSYVKNLRKYKPDFVIHGDDWRYGIQKKIRSDAIKCLKEWNGRIIEPKYTEGISTTDLINTMRIKFFLDL
tara:strand:- start:42 stop:482 length:441 start_codon:yes stop_codon:yes gene_type:complete